MSNRLRDIFFKELTLSSDKWDPYFGVYDTYFNKFVGKSPVVVEVGVQGGGSLQMWEKYFGEGAKITGIDIDVGIMMGPRHDRPPYRSDTKLVIGDQGSIPFWDNFLQETPKIDVFIDDGGHTMEQQMITLEKVFPHIANGGVFICEDTHTSYYPWMNAGLRHPNSFIEYSKRLIDVIHYDHLQDKSMITDEVLQIYKGLVSVAFYDSMVVFLKDEKKEFKRVFSI
jgi:hypothetical protein